jgi:hypothetical protein
MVKPDDRQKTMIHNPRPILMDWDPGTVLARGQTASNTPPSTSDGKGGSKTPFAKETGQES